MTIADPLPESESDGAHMTLLGHLNDLRVRITYAAGALFIGTLLGFAMAQPLLAYLMQPYVNSVPDSAAALQTLRPTEGIETFFKVALLFGAVIAMPFILYQIWLFISPGLTPSEKKYIYIFIPGSLALFLLGILFSWFILVPAAINFLANFMQDVFRTEWTSQDYISFVVRMVFWIGVSFQMPIIVYVLARVGMVTAQMLREQWRYAVVIVAILAAVITPSIDPVTMMLTMAPLIVLYAFSILLARVGQRQFERSVALDAA
ncbi:MAG: twin-arginine translocase subunit TatC [Chloroflexi bacterium]|nr:twin-arginine translocase subunit TatC [Ardenticatenaceae bacterium]MBL1128398.1 twin-arginine translocase subunit TatC [Chloroflexota bacterium]NOG34475.1 twin-arginine translocase subunit TatC [Chloroflexota bacterium]GIK59019.1 MAG: Sec-independent protein translocase protein TatC [Chloroflexota bacterium]